MKTIIQIENLKCHGCANTITKAMNKIEEVEQVNVNIEDSTVEIFFKGTEESIIKFEDKLSKLGYPVVGDNSAVAMVKSYVSCAIGRMN